MKCLPWMVLVVMLSVVLYREHRVVVDLQTQVDGYKKVVLSRDQIKDQLLNQTEELLYDLQKCSAERMRLEEGVTLREGKRR